MATIESVAAHQGWPLRGVPLYNQEDQLLIVVLRSRNMSRPLFTASSLVNYTYMIVASYASGQLCPEISNRRIQRDYNS